MHDLIGRYARHGNLLACLDYVTRIDDHARIVALKAAVAAILRQDGLGRTALAAGRIADADLRQASSILQRINAAESPGVVAEIDALNRTPAAPD